MAPTSRKWVDWTILFTVNATIGVTTAVNFNSGQLTTMTAIVTAAVCFPLLNALALWSVVRRDKRHGISSSASFLLHASSLALVAMVITISTVEATPHQSDLQLALSPTPLEKINPERRRIFVSFLRSRIANSRMQSTDAETTKKHALPFRLYSPESFASVERIDQVLDVIRESSQQDSRYYEKNQADWSEFCAKMAKVDPTYLEAMRQAMAAKNNTARDTAETESQWYTHTVALYGMARVHFKEIQIRNGAVQFPTGQVGQELDRELGVSKELYDKLMKLEQEQAQAQQGAIKQESIR